MSGATELPDLESINRHNRMIEKANARLNELWNCNIKAAARMTGQGVEIAHESPGWNGNTIFYEIIPY